MEDEENEEEEEGEGKDEEGRAEGEEEAREGLGVSERRVSASLFTTSADCRYCARGEFAKSSASSSSSIDFLLV